MALGSSVSHTQTPVRASSPLTSWWICRLDSGVHLPKSSSARCVASSVSLADPPSRAVQVTTYFISTLHGTAGTDARRGDHRPASAGWPEAHGPRCMAAAGGSHVGYRPLGTRDALLPRRS